jgi:hypothetical protein
MKSRIRLAVEQLEHRWCPALTASLRSGTLTISGTADNGTINVVQDTMTAGTINVLDGDTAVSGAPFTGVTNVRLNLTSAADQVKIDLGGQKLAGNVTANLGAGANTLSVVNGSIGGRLAVTSGDDDDTVTLGDGTAALSVKDVDLALFGGIDTVTVASNVNITRSLATLYANNVTLAQGSTVNNVYVRGGTGGNTVTLAGDVTGDAVVDAFFRSGSSAGTTLDVTGSVDGNLLFFGSNQDDTLSVSGDIGKSVAAALFDGADKVTIDGAVTRALALDTGAGNDQISLNNAVGGRVAISAGAGDDQLTIGPAAQLQSAAVINMGAGADTLTLDDAATITTLLANGGTGTDTFVGTPTRTGLTLVSF